MNRPKITVNCLATNEESWIWYAITYVWEYVDEIIVWSHGSTDMTDSLLSSTKSPKLKYKRTVDANQANLTIYRQQMLDQTDADWLMILDGDEIWPDTNIRKTVKFIYDQGQNYEFLIHPYYNLVGDVFHYQDEAAGKYRIGQHQGHITTRFINLKKISGLHYERGHGQIGLFDQQNTLIQDRKPFEAKFLDLPYMHTTHLHRSSLDYTVSKRPRKFKYEIGTQFPENFAYPSTFYKSVPVSIASPWQRPNFSYWLQSLWQTPIRYLKRRLFESEKHGY